MTIRISTYRDQLEARAKKYIEQANRTAHNFDWLMDEEARRKNIMAQVTGDKGGEAVVRIQGPIDDWFGVDVSAIIKNLDQLQPSNIRMILNSPGGIFYQALGLFEEIEALREDGTEVRTETRGLVASAATILFLTGNVREVRPHSQILTHRPWAFAMFMGDAEDIGDQSEDLVSSLQTVEQHLRNIYEAKTGASEEVLDEWIGPKDFNFTAQEALDAGMATVIAGGGDSEDDDDEEKKNVQDLVKNLREDFLSKRQGERNVR